LGKWPLSWRAALITSVTEARPVEIFRVSGPSFWPVVCAVGLVTVFGAEIFTLRPVAILGILVLIIGVVGWNWPDSPPSTDEEEDLFQEKVGIPVLLDGSRVVKRSAMWLWLLLEGIALTSFMFSYFFLRTQSESWPQDNLPLPDASLVGIVTLILLLNGFVLKRALTAVQSDKQLRMRLLLLAGFILETAALTLFFFDLTQLPFDWRTNGYGSIFFGLSGFVIFILLIGLGAGIFTQYWAWRGSYSAKKTLAVNNLTTYWLVLLPYWLFAIGLLYLSPYWN
jgi:cytochrome c oxidase subunit I+III